MLDPKRLGTLAWLFSLLLPTVSGGYPRLASGLTLHSSKTSSFGDPIFDPTTLSVTISPGETAQLPCRVRNLADKVVSWMRRKDLHIISTGNFMFTADTRFYVIHPEHDPALWTLQLRNARLEDEGLYECQVNTDPKMKRSVLLTVAVLDPPEVMELSLKDDSNAYANVGANILGPKLRVIREGSSLTLVCHVKTKPGYGYKDPHRPPRLVDWLHNGKIILFSERSGVNVLTEKDVSDVSSHLTLSSVKVSDTGNYTCKAFNVAPTSIHLEVIQGERSEAMQGSMASACQTVVTLLMTFLITSITLIVNSM